LLVGAVAAVAPDGFASTAREDMWMPKNVPPMAHARKASPMIAAEPFLERGGGAGLGVDRLETCETFDTGRSDVGAGGLDE
jgi:hypothetical protein